MNLRDLRYLVALDEHRHFGRAAEACFVSQPTLSTQIRKLVQRFGNQNITGWSIAALGLYPLFLSISRNALHFYGVSLIGGLAFAFVSGAYANYMLEHIPGHDRPSHLAWYTIILNAAILIGSLAGPAISDLVGLTRALVLFAGLRILAALTATRWNKTDAARRLQCSRMTLYRRMRRHGLPGAEGA